LGEDQYRQISCFRIVVKCCSNKWGFCHDKNEPFLDSPPTGLGGACGGGRKRGSAGPAKTGKRRGLNISAGGKEPRQDKFKKVHGNNKSLGDEGSANLADTSARSGGS